MNKSLATNLIAIGVLGVGYLLPHPILQSIGLFAMSGAMTNWLAIHMLFEKVPGLYGSGVIPSHFEEFKTGIRQLIMEQFFTEENIARFLHDQQSTPIDLSAVIDCMDLSPTFDGLVKTIEESSFGGMLAMIGGAQGLSGLREPFIDRMKKSLKSIANSEQVQNAIQSGIRGSANSETIASQVNTIIEKRMDELTPQMVKEIIQRMIRKHLGWLVVWGGVFGGLIGLLATQLT